MATALTPAARTVYDSRGRGLTTGRAENAKGGGWKAGSLYVLSVPVGYQLTINGARVLVIKSANRAHVELAFDTRKQMLPAGADVHLDHANKRVSLTVGQPKA